MQAYRDQYATLFRDGRDVVLLAVSTDTPEAQAAWARDDEFQFLFGSDEDGALGRTYGAAMGGSGSSRDSRTLFVIDPEGKISYVAAPFRQIDPTAYTDLGTAIDRVAPPRSPSDGS